MNVNKDKNWFISQYSEIHENLKSLELEIQNHLDNKVELLSCPNKLEELKQKTKIEIERLEKTRSYEREIFNY